MEIVNMPIVEYLKLCRITAYQRGFIWVMVLLARERDATNSYKDIKKFWNSYDDLTGDKILFIFSAINHHEQYYQSYPAHQDESWKRVYNPNLLIVNEKVPTIKKWDFPTEREIREYRRKAIENNTYSISKLCQEYDIDESAVPSLLFFSTHHKATDRPIIIPLKDDDIYITIKNILILISPNLKDFQSHQKKYIDISSELKTIKKSIQTVQLSSLERRYINAKAQLSKAKLTDKEKIMIETAINERDLHACKQFRQPIRGYLNQIIDLLNAHNGLEDIDKKWSARHEMELCYRKAEIELINGQQSEQMLMAKARDELEQSLIQLSDILRKNHSEMTEQMRITIPHFKIAVTFSGKYRTQFVEPFCNALLSLGYKKNEIFYDSWHEALINSTHGDSILRQIYFKKCDCVVVLLSPDYREKNWTGHVEWPAVKELINIGNDDKICLLRVESMNIGEIDGLYINQSIAKDIDKMSPCEIAKFIDTKYKILN